jgi:predicted regulator of Ras-like GTPase activity (Roadblock/LC7/MglB family)
MQTLYQQFDREYANFLTPPPRYATVPPLYWNHQPGVRDWSVADCMSRTEQMVDRLRALQASSPDVEASAVVSVDGLTMASALPADVEEDRVAAMSAAMLSLGERIATELGRGELDQVYIRGAQGFVILMAVGSGAVLTVLAREQAKLGLLFLDMRRATEDLTGLL